MTGPGKDNGLPDRSDSAIGRRIRFVDAVAASDTVLMSFRHPAACHAVEAPVTSPVSDGAVDTLDVVLLPLSEEKPGISAWMAQMTVESGEPPLYVKYRGVDLLWGAGRAVLQCDAAQAESLLQALIEFAHYERALRRIEEEIATAWPDLEEDHTLAFEVAGADLSRSEIVGGRMQRALQRRIRFARIEPHLYAPARRLPATAQKLGEALREAAGMETRAEIVDGQLEVFEHVYEMGSQRMGEFKASRQGHIVEWVIVALLVAETLLMLAQTVWRVRG